MNVNRIPKTFFTKSEILSLLGDLLRHEVMSGSKRGVMIYKLMEIGELVPAEVVLDILAEVGILRYENSQEL